VRRCRARGSEAATGQHLHRRVLGGLWVCVVVRGICVDLRLVKRGTVDER